MSRPERLVRAVCSMGSFYHLSRLKGSMGRKGFLFFSSGVYRQVVLYLDNTEHLQHIENRGANLL